MCSSSTSRPLLALVGLFGIYPIIKSITLSFTDSYTALSEPEYVGFRNYLYIFQDKLFLQSVRITLVYALMAVPLNLFGAL